MAHELSDYEKVRLANIQRNQDYLRLIGLDTIKQSINVENIRQNGVNKPQNGSSSSSSRRIKNPKNEPLEPTRRSSRVAKNPVDNNNKNEGGGDDGDYIDDKNDDDDDYNDLPLPIALAHQEYDNLESERNFITAGSLLDFISSKGYLDIGELKLKDIQHCTYRMSYMSVPALGTRLRKISKSLSKQSMTKATIFYFALYHANLIPLAKEAATCLVHYGMDLQAGFGKIEDSGNAAQEAEGKEEVEETEDERLLRESGEWGGVQIKPEIIKTEKMDIKFEEIKYEIKDSKLLIEEVKERVGVEGKGIDVLTNMKIKVEMKIDTKNAKTSPEFDIDGDEEGGEGEGGVEALIKAKIKIEDTTNLRKTRAALLGDLQIPIEADKIGHSTNDEVLSLTKKRKLRV